ncbi:hypothetical protein NIE88_12820 [Sporolactobacillus shoreicorticis]|uniref:Uncharacterized protein n=1 Tax=Sporolactobacillus shoreicorticis TaxID=1923877 RepID=A0ABW5S6E0_9BACL|nr:hypothetical protein [Sporolactobacillus shoreicorticis]MCO7126647.1 hypothetical protein [Sporolactobacillus shoreicorticis]
MTATLDLCAYLLNDPALPALLIALELSFHIIQHSIRTERTQFNKYMQDGVPSGTCMLLALAFNSGNAKISHIMFYLIRTVRRRDSKQSDSKNHCFLPAF